MSAEAVARGLADTFDVAVYLTGVLALVGFAGGAVAVRAARKWRRVRPHRRPVTVDLPTRRRVVAREGVPFWIEEE